jgi:hypothetical protein
MVSKKLIIEVWKCLISEIYKEENEIFVRAECLTYPNKPEEQWILDYKFVKKYKKKLREGMMFHFVLGEIPMINFIHFGRWSKRELAEAKTEASRKGKFLFGNEA